MNEFLEYDNGGEYYGAFTYSDNLIDVFCRESGNHRMYISYRNKKLRDILKLSVDEENRYAKIPRDILKNLSLVYSRDEEAREKNLMASYLISDEHGVNKYFAYGRAFIVNAKPLFRFDKGKWIVTWKLYGIDHEYLETIGKVVSTIAFVVEDLVNMFKN